MKTLLKYIFTIVAFGIFATTTFAGSVNESPSIPTVQVTSGYTKNTWSKSASIGDGDKLAVQLHYYLQEGDSTSNMKFRAEDLAGKTFSQGDSINVWGEVSASGLSTERDTARVRFSEDVRLEFHGVTWQIYPCQSTGCEEALPSDYRQITSSGMNIGGVEGWHNGDWNGRHYAGNVIVEFRAYKIEASYDDCTLDGVTVAHGDSHRFYSQESTTGTCSAYDLVRTCNDGNLSGSDSYRYASCTVEHDNNNEDINIYTRSATNVDEDSARLRGEMRGDDNIDVWFAFDEHDSTPSCNSSSQRVGRTTADDNDDFAETVTSLDENEKYYYRACGEDASGDIVSGYIKSFVTDEDNDKDDNDNDIDPRVVTSIASGIGTHSARLNAYVFGEDDAVCYFQYGRTSSMGLVTSRDTVDLDRVSTCSSLRTNLASNQRYYFRAIMLHEGTVYYGDIKSFRTDKVATNPNPAPNPNPNPAPTIGDLEISKWVSAEDDPRFTTYTQAESGDTVFYKVRVENNTGKDIDNLRVTDYIPFYLEIDTNRSTDDDNDAEIEWNIDLRAGDSRTFVTELRVREDAREGDSIISYASAESAHYSANSNDVEIEVEREFFEEDDEYDENDNQGAFIFGAGIWPNDLTGWGILILILLAIAYFINQILISRNENKKVMAELEAARAMKH